MDKMRMEPPDLTQSNIEKLAGLDLLFGCLLEWDLLPYISEQVQGCTVHTYNNGDLIACFDEDIPDTRVKVQ